MTGAYLAICGAPPFSAWIEQLLASLPGSNLEPLLELPQLRFFGARAQPRTLLEGGLVWGHLFDRATNCFVPDKPKLAAEARRGDALIERFWGGYIAVQATDDGVSVLRDPSGHMPCYHLRIDSCSIFTSRIDLLREAHLFRPAIDWTIVAQAVAYRDWRPEATALAGVAEVLPGMRWRWSPVGIAKSQAWSPWAFVAPEQEIDDYAKAAECIRRVGTSCIGAWSKCFDRPLVELSGGFDSSLVAVIVARTNCQALLATLAAAEGDFDETPYAQAVADHVGRSLAVCRATIADIDPTRSQAAGLPRPCARGFVQSMDALMLRAGAEAGADAFFSGAGGDNVFSYQQSVLPLVDRTRRHGIVSGWASAADIAALAQTSIWEVLGRGTLRLLRREHGMPWHRRTALLEPTLAAGLGPPIGHPWSDPPNATLPGKRIHVRGLMTIQNHLEGFARQAHAPMIAPLLAQPLMETCLRIPSWLWCERGWNRAVARTAFASFLPEVITSRRTKGAFDSYVSQILEHHRSTIRGMLLDGKLVRQGLVVPSRLEAVFAQDRFRSDALADLLALVDIEAWLLSWER